MAFHHWKMIQCILLSSYSIFHLRADATDTYMIIELDTKKLEKLAVHFKDSLEKQEFNLCQAKKEWIKIT